MMKAAMEKDTKTEILHFEAENYRLIEKIQLFQDEIRRLQQIVQSNAATISEMRKNGHQPTEPEQAEQPILEVKDQG